MSHNVRSRCLKREEGRAEGGREEGGRLGGRGESEHIITVGHRPYSRRSADMAVHGLFCTDILAE